MAYQSINPYTGEEVASFPEATDAEIEQALATAHEAFKSWRALSFDERAEYLRRAAGLFRERAEELSLLQTAEMGMPLSLSRPQTEYMIPSMLEYYAENAEAFLADEKLDVNEAEGETWITHQPLGIIYAVEPWNGPFYQAIRPACGNLMAGNVVMLKHASNIPGCADAVAQVFTDAGLPEGVFTNVFATHDQSARIVADPRVRGVTLTGSDAAGARIGEQAGRAIKPAVLELGGSDPMIVLEDADLALTARCSMFRFLTSGQACISNKRIIVVDSIYDEYLEQYKQMTEGLTPGDPADPATGFGPLSSKEAADGVREQIRRAVEAGATAIEVGPKVPDVETFVQATILTDVTPDNPVYYEEIFGPVPVIFRVRDEAEAIELANDSPYGLGGGVYSQDIERAKRVAAQIDTGMVAINAPLYVYDDMPFGGTKRSGIGKEMGPHGIKEFVNSKLITIPVSPVI
ncbi:MAG TPA: NAD-dependent succinate-semialdehyde dehydrogenase [Actinomycetaceae bacterium]|nr:NAD-dependent succinate-semialdehyde dehydrogenase [Actinomycetaceae bacterium]